MGYAHFVRSPHAHARIVSIDTSRAEALDGVFATLTGEDVKEESDPFFQIAPEPAASMQEYCLAVGKVRYTRKMRPKIGPMAVSNEGAAVPTEVDEESRRAVISLRAREAKGQGTAMATITNSVDAADAGARVTAETDLHITVPRRASAAG
jgi:xanthine dehydrogenase molybdopterin-binding subunit B